MGVRKTLQVQVACVKGPGASERNCDIQADTEIEDEQAIRT